MKESEAKGHLVPHYKERHIDIFPVTTEELKSIGSSSAQATLFFSLLGVAIGSLATVVVALATVEIRNAFVSKGFWLASFVSGFAAIYFGIKGRMASDKQKELVKTIEKQCAG